MGGLSNYAKYKLRAQLVLWLIGWVFNWHCPLILHTGWKACILFYNRKRSFNILQYMSLPSKTWNITLYDHFVNFNSTHYAGACLSNNIFVVNRLLAHIPMACVHIGICWWWGAKSHTNNLFNIPNVREMFHQKWQKVVNRELRTRTIKIMHDFVIKFALLIKTHLTWTKSI